MNIYISDCSLHQCAKNLDTPRLRKQVDVLSQIISNIIHLDNSYIDIINYCNFSNFRLDRDIEISDVLFPLKYETHGATLWARKSPLHFLFILVYIAECVKELQNRDTFISINAKKLFNKVNNSESYLYGVLNCDKLSPLYGLNKELYKNIPVEGLEQEDTIESYRKYLIYHWKNDLNKYYKYLDDLKKYKANGGVKPRAAKNITWHIRHAFKEIPIFAVEELIRHKEALENSYKDN